MRLPFSSAKRALGMFMNPLTGEVRSYHHFTSPVRAIWTSGELEGGGSGRGGFGSFAASYIEGGERQHRPRGRHAGATDHHYGSSRRGSSSAAFSSGNNNDNNREFPHAMCAVHDRLC